MAPATPTIVNATSKDNVRTPIVSYTPSMWGDTFTSFSFDHQVQEKYAEEIETLKEDAKSMLMAKGNTKSEKLVLIDTLEHLGVAYHFDQEIEEQLEQIFKSHCDHDDDDDLFITSLQFRLLRQHRHYISSGVFDKFTEGKNNKFKESFSDDVKGLLSLYEAAHLRIHGEQVLEEAVGFTVHHLKRMVQHELESPLQDQVRRALEQPLHRGNPRIEARHYISLYEKNNSKIDDVLLKLAKLDFNYLQNTYKNELSQVSRWWKELDLKSKFPYVRDRVVEGYLWGASYHFKPQYSYGRVAVAKVIQMLTILDDTYDNYATVEEAHLFTHLIERWNIDEIDQLPDYMKIIYRFILSVYDQDYEREATEQGKPFAVPYAKETVKQVCKAYNKEMKWAMRGEIMPSFEEYIINSVISGCFFAIFSITIPGIESITKETIDWLMSQPKIVEASSKVCRYLDDVGSFERESKQGKYLTGVDYYMKQYGLSMQETANKFMELAEDEWKNLNKEWLDKTNNGVSKDMLEHVVGYARASELFYRSHQDGYTKTEVLAPDIVALFVDPIII